MQTRAVFRSLPAFLVAVVIAAAAAAQPAGQSTARPLAFTVSMPDPAAHLYHVVLRCEDLPVASETVEFRMPAWTPGYYGLFDFAGNVRNLSASDGEGRALPSEKSAANAWTVQKGAASAVTLSYDVVAASTFVAQAYLDETRAYINPGALLVYVPGRIRHPATVTVETNGRWSTIATGLDPVSPDRPHTYYAPDFDVLYDSPILAGNLDALPSFEIQGIPHYFVGYELGTFDRQAFIADLKAVIEAGTTIIGDIPYTHYTFMAIGPGPGGIEHLNSTAFGFTARANGDRAARNRELAFLAHEYFHAYNVKRIRPIALGPFDYDKANPTDMLWVSEGFTVYYEYLMLARSGRMTQDEVLAALSRNLAACENDTGHLFQSATEASRETWNQGPFGGRGAKGIRKTISYYEKGPILGLLLDLKIRHETRNAKSLDTVMRLLYDRYYKKLGRGWTDEEFRQACEEVAGARLDENFEYASTTKAIDYDRYLAYAGLALEPPQELPDAWLGAIVEDQGGRPVVAAVESGSPAARAGLTAGDVLEAFGATPLADAKAVETAVAAMKPGDRAVLRVARGGASRAVDVTLAHKVRRTYKIVPLPHPDALQAAIRRSFTS